MDPQITQKNADAGESDPQTYAIIGAAFEVHRQLGPGFLETVYQEALCVELVERRIPFAREVTLPVLYKGRALNCTYRADVICYEAVLVELKAQAKLTGIEQAQVLNYLKATRLQRALLLNFGTPKLDPIRIVLSGFLRSSASSADQSGDPVSGDPASGSSTRE